MQFTHIFPFEYFMSCSSCSWQDKDIYITVVINIMTQSVTLDCHWNKANSVTFYKSMGKKQCFIFLCQIF